MITLPIWLAVLIIMAAACIGFLFASMCKVGGGSDAHLQE